MARNTAWEFARIQGVKRVIQFARRPGAGDSLWLFLGTSKETVLTATSVPLD